MTSTRYPLRRAAWASRSTRVSGQPASTTMHRRRGRGRITPPSAQRSAGRPRSAAMLGSWPSTPPRPRRVVVLGKNRLAVECLPIIQSSGDQIVLAMPEPGDDGQAGWQPSFRASASAAGIPILQPDDLNAQEVIDAVSATNPDFLLSFQAGQILRRALLSVPILGAWNVHFGSLPRYRGVAPIAWAIINGERATGVTLHRIDPGVDSGAILATAEVPIARERPVGRCTRNAPMPGSSCSANGGPACASAPSRRAPRRAPRRCTTTGIRSTSALRAISWRSEPRSHRQSAAEP